MGRSSGDRDKGGEREGWRRRRGRGRGKKKEGCVKGQKTKQSTRARTRGGYCLVHRNDMLGHGVAGRGDGDAALDEEGGFLGVLLGLRILLKESDAASVSKPSR